MRSGEPLAEALVGYAARQSDRDEDLVARLTGTTEDLARRHAVALLGTEDPVAVGLVGARLRARVRQAGTLTPEEAEALVAAEVIEGTRTEIGREVEALLGEHTSKGL